MDSHLLTQNEESTLYLTLNNPTKANSMSANLVSSLQRALDSAYHDNRVRTVVFTASGKFFCTGMDFSSDGDSMAEHSPELHDQRYRDAVKLYETISGCPKTTIALVNGPCYGGGNGIVFACDIRIVVRSTKFVLSEVTRGLSPATISRYIVREWGTSLAREAMITGRMVEPEELKAFGAVQHIVEDIDEGRRRLAATLENLRVCAPRAITQSKRLVNAVYEENSSESGKIIQDVFMDMTRPSEEAAHGILQFRKGIRTIDWSTWYRSKKSPKL